MTDDTRYAPTGILGDGIILLIREKGLTSDNEKILRLLLIAAYDQGMKDGLDIAKVLRGERVYSHRRPPPHLDPVSAYDS